MARIYFWLLLFLLQSGPRVANALELQEVPEPLKPWIDWVLHDESQYRCPFLFDDFQQKRCAWPGSMRLNVQAKQGTFSADWIVYRKDWITLPGDTQHWPQSVTVNQRAWPVVEKDGKPALQLPAGHYQITGAFAWEQLPEQLALREASGLLKLSINDTPVVYPRIKQGVLWLNEGDTAATAEQDRLDLQVFRQIIDDAPLQIVTRLALEISGKPREVELPYALLPGFIPVNIDSPLPARLDTNGRLRVEVRAGRWSIDVHGRHPQWLTQVDLAVADPNWPSDELWAFQANPGLRLVEIDNLPAIDGSQTNLPDEWRQLPTYQVKQGDSLQFKLMRRGDPEPEPNQLKLNRKLWLDFEGDGYTVSDIITGTMSRDWRLDALPDLRLGQVQLDGQNQLITRQPDDSQGVEVRRGTVQLNADSRIENRIGSITATGWRQRFQEVSAELNVPPGWRLLAVTGVDNQPDSWVQQWTMLDFFLVLVAALAIGQLWTPAWGCIALVGLGLIWHEADAPQLVWLNTLAAIALLRVFPDNRLRPWLRAYRNLSWLVLVSVTIPFMVDQVCIAIYPQLEYPETSMAHRTLAVPAPMPMALQSEAVTAMPAAPERDEPADLKRVYKADPAKAQAYSYGASDSLQQRLDPEANLQTGPGLPQWHWRSVYLNWSDAVDQNQRIGLWYLPPVAMMWLRVVQALLVAVLALKLIGAVGSNWRLAVPNLACLLLLPLLLTPAPPAYADLPDQQLLEQLRTRLLQAPTCLPACAQITAMHLDAKPELLAIELQVDTQADLAVPLPAQLEQWFPEQVIVDGGAAQTLIRHDDGGLWLAVGQGVHRVALQGRYSNVDKFSLPLPLPPQYTRVSAAGWRVDGLYEDGKVGPQLEFNRLQADPGSKTALAPTALPPFVRVDRTVHFGLDWRITTRVEQLASNDSPILLEVPLWPGEAVISPQVRVKDGKVLVNMAAGQNQLEWESSLAKTDQLTLQAAATEQWHEVWRADVSPIWHVGSEGLAVVHHRNAEGQWLPEWRPWPGEVVKLTIARPPAVAGATLTIDSADVDISVGQRSETVTLQLTIRSSKGGQHPIKLPAGAELQSVMIDGASQPIRQQADGVNVPIHPGRQLIVLTWQAPRELGIVTTTPAIDLGVVSVNSRINLTLPVDRWLLWTDGPAFGPAMLFWGLLAVIALVAAGLGKVALTPLGGWQWFGLLVGLSQLTIAAAFLVVGWLLALGWRADHPAERPRWFNLGQIGLAGLTLLAFLTLALAVQQGLLGMPDMQIAGNQSDAYQLHWYQDRNLSALATASIISVPIEVYRGLMLVWALWLAAALLRWWRWGWGCFSSGGVWKKALLKPAQS